jgi:hypothetical protein
VTRFGLLAAVLLAGCGEVPAPPQADPATDKLSPRAVNADLAIARTVLAESVATIENDPDAAAFATLAAAYDRCAAQLAAIRAKGKIADDDPNPYAWLIEPHPDWANEWLEALVAFQRAVDELAPVESSLEKLSDPESMRPDIAPPAAAPPGAPPEFARLARAEYLAALLLRRIEERDQHPPFAPFAIQITKMRGAVRSFNSSDRSDRRRQELALSLTEFVCEPKGIGRPLGIGPLWERVRERRREDAARIADAKTLLAQTP